MQAARQLQFGAGLVPPDMFRKNPLFELEAAMGEAQAAMDGEPTDDASGTGGVKKAAVCQN